MQQEDVLAGSDRAIRCQLLYEARRRLADSADVLDGTGFGVDLPCPTTLVDEALGEPRI
jgi:hypothetical protein